MHYIYKITNILNNKIYIGQTNRPEWRWYGHKRAAVKNEKSDMAITRAIKKYGEHNFTFEIIMQCKTLEDANFLEVEMISQYNLPDANIGYNISIGGDKFAQTPSIKKKISKGLKRYYKTHDGPRKGAITPQHVRDKQSAVAMGKLGTNLGKTFTVDHSRKIADANAGKEMKDQRKFKEDIEKEICRLYVEGEWSKYKLKNHYKCHSSLIHEILIRNNIKTRESIYTKGSANFNNKRFKDFEEKEICRLYIEDRLSASEISRKYDCNPNVIRGVLLRYNIDLKTKQYKK